ncbi:MAG: ribokinase [Chloroflexota bacterium]|nr:ribokinase [Chloroflexota bacterium]
MTSPTPALRPVVVLGSINTDLVVRAAHFPRPGETMHGSDFAVIGGGKGANQATAAARLGAPVQFVGAVGTDDFGTRRIEELAEAGVDVAGIVRIPDSPTGVALITVNAQGENTIIVAAGANWRVMEEHISGTMLAMAAGGLLVAQLELPLETTAAGLARARMAGLTTLLNTAPYNPEARSLLHHVDILVANEVEAGDLAEWASVVTEENGADVAARLRARGPQTVIVTLGAAGVIVATATETTLIPAPRVQVVDTTGAGDCFTGAFAAALVGGAEIDEAVRRAVAAASYSTTIFGATTGMPTTEQLDAFVRSMSAS